MNRKNLVRRISGILTRETARLAPNGPDRGLGRPTLPMAVAGVILFSLIGGCGGSTGGGESGDEMKIAFLHHSTGKNIWDGGVRKCLKKQGRENKTKYDIREIAFPKESPYGWNNYPYDYWKIWVENAGPDKYLDEPTLEILTEDYQVIVFKHCFPVSDISPDTGSPDVASSEKKLENYKLQYAALKEKMLQFPETKFLVWTGAALVEQRSDNERGARAREFASWVQEEWNEPGDNIFVWDLFTLETGGGLFMKEEFAQSPTNSHPNREFSKKAAEEFCKRLVQIIEE
ncbi:MAG: hypothetical protein KOO63_11175 [Bacteroidales bacterium]|nr:hypothetical protein [Candidatus Latescibacterota bacterium]